MRIAFVNSKYGFGGGVEKYIYQTGKLLQEYKYKICGIFENKEKDDSRFNEVFSNFLIYNNHSVEAIESVCGKIDFVFIHKITDLGLLEKLKQSYPTILLVHDHDYYCFRRHKYFPVTRINCNRPFNFIYCSICSGLIEKSDGIFPIKPINSLARARMLKSIRGIDRFIVLSQYMKNNLIMNGFPTEKISKIYPFIKRGEKRSYEVHNPARILYVGQIIRGKGVDLLLEACKMLRNSFTLNILGKGNDSEHIKARIEELGLEDRITMVGFTYDVDRYYREADLVVVPSRWQEPFGLIGTEAFNQCKPVVGFDVGGITEWLHNGENGVAAAEGDVAGLAAGIDYLIEHPEEAEAMGLAGYRLLEKAYKPEHFLKGFEGVMEDLDV